MKSRYNPGMIDNEPISVINETLDCIEELSKRKFPDEIRHIIVKRVFNKTPKSRKLSQEKEGLCTTSAHLRFKIFSQNSEIFPFYTIQKAEQILKTINKHLHISFAINKLNLTSDSFIPSLVVCSSMVETIEKLSMNKKGLLFHIKKPRKDIISKNVNLLDAWLIYKLKPLCLVPSKHQNKTMTNWKLIHELLLIYQIFANKFTDTEVINFVQKSMHQKSFQNKIMYLNKYCETYKVPKEIRGLSSISPLF